MRILWIGRNDEQCISSRLNYLREALSKITEVIPIGRGFQKRWRINTDVEKLVDEHNVDAVVFRSGPDIHWDLTRPLWKNLDRVKVPKAMIYSDPQTYRGLRAAWINKNKIDMTFHTYRTVKAHLGDLDSCSMDKFRIYVFPEHKSRWLPNAVNIDVFKDYGYEREYDVCILGRVTGLYRLRKKMWPELRARTDIKVLYRHRIKKSWGWNRELRDRHKILMREDYAQALSRCKVFPFDSSIYKYALTKYFESMATKTLALADVPMDAEDLHFIPDENFVEINKENYSEKIDYYLENKDERDKIVERAYNMVRKYHSTDVRAKQMVGYLKEMM